MEERLNKFIARCGVCSRRKADELISEGTVRVNETVVTELGFKVTKKDKVFVNNVEIKDTTEYLYIKINKPVGYVTTAKEQLNRPCVLDLIKESNRVYPVGRLDMYSEGLLILTNDGDFTNKIIHPKNHISKTYEVRLNKKISNKDMITLSKGVDIGDYVTREAYVSKIADNEIRIVIFEGKNRQIRRMCEALGYKVLTLKRIKIGTLELGNLKSGEYKYLTKKEIQKVFK